MGYPVRPRRLEMALKVRTGVFYDSPVQGLEYRTETLSGITDEKAQFKYRSGETVTFSVGGLVLGATAGKEILNLAEIILEVGGDINRINKRRLTNIARFLQSLNRKDNIEECIKITEEIRKAVSIYRYDIDFDQAEETFTADPAVNNLFKHLKSVLRTPEQARNHLRRTMYGIKKSSDVKIPMSDGSYLLANIFHPITKGKYPAIVTLGAYGKEFREGRICDEKDLLNKEIAEDRYFEAGNPPPAKGADPLPFENAESANTTDWVPRGYVLIRVDARGVGQSPGLFEQFSYQEAKDLYDVIEWSAKQSWSSGKVGLFGSGYYAMVAYNVAQLQPPHLKAMINIGGDSNSYRDYVFTGGGLYNSFNSVVKNSCGEWKGVDWVSVAMKEPFDDPEIYGPAGKICISPDLSKVKVPFWSATGISGTLHTRGSSEAFINAGSKQKKFTFISEPGIHLWPYTRTWMNKWFAYMDYWLKGIDTGIMEEPAVEVMIRSGYGGFYWIKETDWPIPGTKYIKFYLDASLSSFKGNEKRKDFLKLDKGVPKSEKSYSYNAGVDWKPDNAWSHGVSFISEPMVEEMVIAGYPKLVAWVSSSSYDMELHTSIRVIDENNKEVQYPIAAFDDTAGRMFPVGFGGLKVSHRKLDRKRSTIFRPYHTHKKADYLPLKSGEAVEAEVEIWPTTAVIRKGSRIQLDVQPAVGAGIGMRIYDALDQKYQKGSSNSIHTGPEHLSYLQLPLIPSKRE